MIYLISKLIQPVLLGVVKRSRPANHTSWRTQPGGLVDADAFASIIKPGWSLPAFLKQFGTISRAVRYRDAGVQWHWSAPAGRKGSLSSWWSGGAP
mgnify:FL=1